MQQIYIVLSHLDVTYENEFLGIFTEVDLAKQFIADTFKDYEKFVYSKITIHPVEANRGFDYTSFSEATIFTYSKIERSKQLGFV